MTTTTQDLFEGFDAAEEDGIRAWAAIQPEQLEDSSSQFFVLDPDGEPYSEAKYHALLLRIEHYAFTARVTIWDLRSSVSSASLWRFDELPVLNQGSPNVARLADCDFRERRETVELATGLKGGDINRALSGIQEALHLIKVIELRFNNEAFKERDSIFNKHVMTTSRALEDNYPKRAYTVQTFPEFLSRKLSEDEQGVEKLSQASSMMMWQLLAHRRGEHQAKSSFFQKEKRWICGCDPELVALITK